MPQERQVLLVPQAQLVLLEPQALPVAAVLVWLAQIHHIRW